MNSIPRRRLLMMGFVVALAASLMLVAPVVRALAQDDDIEELEDLKDERDRVTQEAAVAVGQIDVGTATVDEVTRALDELEAFVSLQRIRLEEAQHQYDAAVAEIDRAREEKQRVVREAEAVHAHLTELAVSSFTGEGAAVGDDLTELILSDDPGESARFIHLLELQTGSLSDGIDRLRMLELQAEQLVVAEQVAVDEAEESLRLVDARVAELDEAQAAQERVVAGAEIRLEAQIAEAAILEERDVELAMKIRDQQASINQRIAVSARTNGVDIPPPVDLLEIIEIDFFEDEIDEIELIAEESGTDGERPLVPVEVVPFFSIEVHEEIVDQTQALFESAFEAGIDLGGWGYRPIQLQIELRAAHCGGSEYDIWHKPVFECAPPTARPGFSKHEQGRAIDFTFNGASIQSHESPGYVWLKSNAPKYGFVNLESEPWHWSIAEGEERLPG